MQIIILFLVFFIIDELILDLINLFHENTELEDEAEFFKS